jgi:hypothetical protein
MTKYSKEELIELFKMLGVPDPDEWAESELNDKQTAYLAVFRFLRPLQQLLDGYLYRHDSWVKSAIERDDPDSKVIKEMVDAGISSEQIGWFAYWITRYAINIMLYHLDDPAGADFDLPDEGEGFPNWCLVERISYRDGNVHTFEYTGRILQGMYSLFPYKDLDKE